MAKLLFTMVPANDLGLPTRLVPIARALADRGHEVALFNPSPAPAKLISEAGLTNLPMPSPAMPVPGFDPGPLASAWDLEEMFATIYSDEEYARADVAFYVDLLRAFSPEAVIDSFGLPACIAARALRIPLVSVLQGNFHPASDGFLWWKGERPAHLPSAAATINHVASELGVAPLTRCVDFLAGDLALIVGTPETDPLPESAHATHIGPIVWQRGDARLPAWVSALSRDRPVIWVYSGNPRYGRSVATSLDSIVVIRAAIAALGGTPLQVVLTTGFQELPSEFGVLPPNFHHARYLPGQAMAERCDLMVHHGGHSSVMMGMLTGTPAVIIPTITERESNARRAMMLGAAEIVMPITGTDGEKRVDIDDFGSKVRLVLAQSSYREAAQRVAASMRKLGGVREAADRIERLTAGD
jgi:UDP:flavonoid glycosyltransferase YjiC (YdhE family)